jgi:hypothetical protein
MAKNDKPKWGELKPSRDAIKDALRPYRISLPTLRKMVREVNSPRHPPPMNRTEASFRLSALILLDFMGAEWLDHYVTHKGLLLESTYFGKDDLFYDRIVGLAEMMLNLQDVPGFKGCLSTMAGDIESGYAELEVGKFLSWFGAKFKFNQPIRQPKSDFDFHVVFKNGCAGYGEIKSKRESGPLTKMGVYNILRIARDQFPNDKPAVVFLKLPESWADVENRKTIDEQVYKFLRGTQTVVAVELFITGFRVEGTVADTIISGVEVLNRRHKFDLSLDWSLIGNVAREPTGYIPPTWWRSIHGLIDPAVDPRKWRP